MTHLTTTQIANRLGVAPRTVAKWIDTGQLIGYRLPPTSLTGKPRRDRRVRLTDLIEFLQRHKMPQEMAAAADPIAINDH